MDDEQILREAKAIEKAEQRVLKKRRGQRLAVQMSAFIAAPCYLGVCGFWASLTSPYGDAMRDFTLWHPSLLFVVACIIGAVFTGIAMEG